MPSPRPRRWWRRALIAVAILLVLAGGAAAFVLLHTPGNVSHPNLSFTTPTTTTTAVVAPKKHKKVVNNFLWGRYGFDETRTRSFPGAKGLHPPLHVGWRYNDYALLEFPPVIYQNTLYSVYALADTSANIVGGYQYDAYGRQTTL